MSSPFYPTWIRPPPQASRTSSRGGCRRNKKTRKGEMDSQTAERRWLPPTVPGPRLAAPRALLPPTVFHPVSSYAVVVDDIVDGDVARPGGKMVKIAIVALLSMTVAI